METKNKNALIGGLLAIVFVMAVGYAAFATQLNINGTANITSSWDVHIKSLTAGTPVGTATSRSADVVEGNPLEVEFETELLAPGDSLTYTVEVENSGSLPAKLSNIKFNQTQSNTATEEGKDTRTIIYSYAGISINDVLEPGATKSFTVTVQYNPAITTQPEENDKTSILDMQLSYVQNTDTTSGE